jgi:hypothetical protein
MDKTRRKGGGVIPVALPAIVAIVAISSEILCT